MIVSRLSSILRLPPSHVARTGLLFLFAFGSSGAYVAARSDADALFLARVGVDRLPAMILVAATGIAITTSLYARVTARRNLAKIVLASHHMLGVTTLFMAVFLNAGGHDAAIPVVLYLLAELRGTLGTIQFATLLNEMFRRSAPSEVSGIAGAGSTLAGIVVGGIVGWLAGEFGTRSVLYLIVGLDVFAGLTVLQCRPYTTSRKKSPASSTSPEGAPEACSNAALPEESRKSQTAEGNPQGPIELLKNVPLARYVAGLICLRTVVVLLIDFEWKSVAASQYLTENELAGFFGTFYAIMFALTAGLQLFGTSRLLKHFGIQSSLASYPGSVAMVLATVMLASTGTAMFWRLSIARGCDVLRRGLADSALNVIYWPLGPGVRRQVIALCTGWIKPLTEAVAAVLLIPLAVGLTHQAFSLVITCLCAVWVVVIYRGRSVGGR